ncbi:hypothetical protein BDM02DRAFT_3122253 [Thelephora ganbajun]|uniref:Uncharacterized protein n=1 Tax=Thelephora ganbajun TaxID=370292 RepID=A0ACB6Z3U0_THEGA|nr:hypothetical protein BDM02DRAFT_3122253 [Thelephora ganbajun]
MDAARLYLEFSGSCPISFTWYHRDWNQDPVIHDILSPASPRLKTITISTTGFNVRDSLLTTLGAMSFPILEHLKCTANQYPYPDEVSLTTANLYAPRLRHGVFVNYMVPIGTLSSLVALEIALFGYIRQFNAAAFLDLLRNVAQTLKCLTLRALNRALQGHTPSASTIQLPELVVLTLRSASELLLFISTPNLHTLCLEGHAENTISPFANFDAPKLTYLKLDSFPLLDLETVLDFPWRFQELETAVLHQCQSSKSFFCHASSTRDGISAFPSLSSIFFSDPGAFAPIRSMVETWKAADPDYSTLKRLWFAGGDYVLGADDIEWITAQGIEFSEGPNVKEPWTTMVF